MASRVVLFQDRSNKANALSHLAVLELADGLWEEAEQHFLEAETELHQALTVAPREVSLLNNFGVLKMHFADLRAETGRCSEAEGRHRRSIQAFSRVLAQDRQNPLFLLNMGSALHRRGKMFARQKRRTAAQRSYRAAIGVNDYALGIAPEYLRALANKGMYCEELGWLILRWARPHRQDIARQMFQEGVDAHETAHMIAPDEPRYREGLARLSDRLETLEN